MFNKFELIGAGVSVGCMLLALYLLQAHSIFSSTTEDRELSAQAIEALEPDIVIVQRGENVNQMRADAYVKAADNRGNINSMVIDDIKIGTGDEVKEGDTVAVHYIGTLQNGQEFDNSHKRGLPFEFKVGSGMVIEGWDKGLVGMKTGGQRVLVIPPEMAYGSNGMGPIPGNATLVFAIELVEIK